MDNVEQLLSRGVEEIIGREQLEKKVQSNKPLRIKLGIDPTSPNIHLGRSIPLMKLRDFQEMGHNIVFIIGDFTGVIGDTSDKDSERPMLTEDAIAENLKEYAAQAGKIIDLDKCEVHHNSEWLGKLTYAEIGKQANAFSVAEFIARDNIRRRLDAGKRVSLREMLYPLMQGYDSVAIEADVELGGTDQRFNLLAGRKLQEAYGQEPQSVMMGPLVEGTDGRKMSSSWGNTINITDEPNDMFGKVMKVQDELIIKYFTLMTRVPMETIAEYEAAMKDGANPRDYKMKLGAELVRFYHNEEAAKAAQEYFVNTFAKKQIPEVMDGLDAAGQNVVTALVEGGYYKSNSEVRRLIKGGGLKHWLGGGEVNKLTIDNPDYVLTKGEVLQLGKKRFVKIY